MLDTPDGSLSYPKNILEIIIVYLVLSLLLDEIRFFDVL